MSFYFDKKRREFYLSLPTICERLKISPRLLIYIGTFDDNGECDVNISRTELFRCKLLAKNPINEYVEVIK